MALLNNIYLRWITVGFLLGGGFLQPLLWPLGLVGIGYFLYLLLESESTILSKLLGSGLAWTIKYLCSLLWFWSAYPIDWLAVELGGIQILLIFFYWFTASLWLGFGGVLVAAVSIVLGRYGSITKTYLYFLMPFLWVAGEVAGSLVFSIVTYGPGSNLTPAFSFGYVGYLLGNHNVLLLLSYFGGVYILTMVTVALAVGLFLFKPLHTRPVLMLVLVTVLYSSGFYDFKESDVDDIETYQVLTIDTAFPVDKLRARDISVTEALNNAVAEALTSEPDYIVLPEDSRLFDQSGSVGTAKARFQLQFDNPQVMVIDSSRFDLPDRSGAVLQTFIYDGDNPVGRVQKRYLVPQGEYMPTLYANTLTLLGYGNIIERMKMSIDFRVGKETNQSVLSEVTPGILFCFESVNPLGVRQIMRERTDVPFIAHPISHAWFHEPYQLWQQLDVMLKIQSVWNQQYIISAGGNVSGSLYTPSGSIIKPRTISSGEEWSIREVNIPK
tara:strand:- start:1578 stop:3068 length:1491 start_codon:yes stop_codon:yes gene_type:complete